MFLVTKGIINDMVYGHLLFRKLTYFSQLSHFFRGLLMHLGAQVDTGAFLFMPLNTILGGLQY